MTHRNSDALFVEQLYTKRAKFYRWLFIRFFRYGAGLQAFFRDHPHYRAPQVTRVLDAGCGSGTLVRGIHAVDPDVARQFFAFDLTQKMLDDFSKWASSQKKLDLTLIKADVTDPAWGRAQGWHGFDMVMSSAMLEYVPKESLPIAFENLRESLSDDGILLLFITRKNVLMHWLIEKWWKARAYSKEEINDLLVDAGFTDVRFERFPFPYSHLNIWGHISEARRG